MSLTIKESRGDFILAPEGLHIARCYALVDLGQQENKRFATHSPKVLIGWELNDVRMEDGRPFVHYQRYTGSLNEKSKLRSLLESWRGKGFTPEELQGFNLKSILGTSCYLTLKHSVNPQTQKTWADVIGICRLPPVIPQPELVNRLVCFDLDHYTESEYLALPESLRNKINLTGINTTPKATTTVSPTLITNPSAESSLNSLEEAQDLADAGNENLPF